MKKIDGKKPKPQIVLFDVECFSNIFVHMFYFPPKLLDLDIFNSLCCRARLRQCNKAAIFQIKLVPYICIYTLNICASKRFLTNKMQNVSPIAVFLCEYHFQYCFPGGLFTCVRFSPIFGQYDQLWNCFGVSPIFCRYGGWRTNGRATTPPFRSISVQVMAQNILVSISEGNLWHEMVN